MFEWIKKKFKKEKEVVDKIQEDLSAKELATLRGEPYINVIGVEIDHHKLEQGAFELDWNDIFVARLIKAGYRGKDDASIVDQWFQTVCRNIVMETWEQDMADPENRGARYTQRKDIGNGRTEVS